MRIPFLVICLCAVPATAAAQPVYIEFGAAVAGACVTAEASCRNTDTVAGLHIGAWRADTVAARFRFMEIPRPDRVDRFGDYSVQRLATARQLWLGELTWHFAKDSMVHPFAGVAIGTRRDLSRTECAPVACDEIPLSVVSVAGGWRDSRKFSVGAVLGVSGIAASRLTWGVQLGIHDFMGEHAGTNMLLLQLGYRHPVRK